MTSRSLPESSLMHLLEQRDKLLNYVKRRVDDPDLAEDIFQDSLLKALQAESEIKDPDRLVPWFYRILSNAVADYYRRRGVAERYQPLLAAEALTTDTDEWTALCGCLRELLPTLKPEYAHLIEALELADGDAAEEASRLNITPNNLKVRRHRARQALRQRLEETCRVCAEHSCLDCTCKADQATEAR